MALCGADRCALFFFCLNENFKVCAIRFFGVTLYLLLAAIKKNLDRWVRIRIKKIIFIAKPIGGMSNDGAYEFRDFRGAYERLLD